MSSSKKAVNTKKDQLAEQSNRGASEVTALVQKVAEGTAAAVEAMHQSQDEVAKGVAVVNRAGAALDQIVTAVNNTVTDISMRTVAASAEESSAMAQDLQNLITRFQV